MGRNGTLAGRPGGAQVFQLWQAIMGEDSGILGIGILSRTDVQSQRRVRLFGFGTGREGFDGVTPGGVMVPVGAGGDWARGVILALRRLNIRYLVFENEISGYGRYDGYIANLSAVPMRSDDV